MAHDADRARRIRILPESDCSVSDALSGRAAGRLGSDQSRADGIAGLFQRSLLNWEKTLGVDPRAGTRREDVFLLHLK